MQYVVALHLAIRGGEERRDDHHSEAASHAVTPPSVVDEGSTRGGTSALAAMAETSRQEAQASTTGAPSEFVVEVILQETEPRLAHAQVRGGVKVCRSGE